MPSLVVQGNKLIDPDGIDPDADLDYEIDLVDWLAQVSDTLLPMPDGLSVEGINCTAHSPSIVGTKLRGWAKNAIAGEEAGLTFKFTTTGGRKENKTIFMRVRDK